MDDSNLVDGLQTSPDLQGHVESPVRHQPPLSLHNLAQVCARDELHGDEMDVPVLPVVIHPADIAVGDLAGEPDLSLKTPGNLRVAGDLRSQHFEGDCLL